VRAVEAELLGRLRDRLDTGLVYWGAPLDQTLHAVLALAASRSRAPELVRLVREQAFDAPVKLELDAATADALRQYTLN
jgi:hypothetical protein